MARADAKLKNLPREALDELWEMKNPGDEDTKAMTLLEICAVIPKRFKIEIGKSALGEFYQWLDLQRRMWARESTVEQMKEIIARDKSLSPEQVKAAGQRLFMADGILEKDAKTFAIAATLENDDVRLKQKDAEIEIRRENIKIGKRKLELLEKKAAQADKAKEITNDSDLTEEEKAARIKQIFRMG
jgi:hypothetical protein